MVLLDQLAAGRIKPAELDRAHDRRKVLADYQVVLTMTGDAKRGIDIFKKNCAACHRIGHFGVNVAPDISDSRVKTAAQILTDILQPNRAIDANYVSYTVQTADGRQLTGIISAETATSVTLRQQEGKDVILLRSEIERMQSNGVSLMPEGLEKTIPPQEMADLIAFIKHWRYLDGRTPLGK
jgi:putative heme-binding domain-containing protein